MINSMVPYFILALAVIVTFHVVSEINVFWGVLSRFWGIISPFFYGLTLAYLLSLPCGGIQKLLKRTQNPVLVRRSRRIAIIILLLIVLTLVALTLNLIIPAIISSIELLQVEFNNYQVQLQDLVTWFNNLDLPEFIPAIYMDDIFDGVREYVDNFNISDLAVSIFAGVGGAFSTVFRAFLTAVSALYFLIEMEKLSNFALRLTTAIFPEKKRNTILKYTRKLNHNFRQYIAVQTVDGLILGTIMTLVLFFVFRSEYALLLGLMLGIINYIPYFGSIIGTAIAVIVIAFTQGIGTAAIAAVLMFAIQQLDGNYIQPRLMGKSFSLSPLLVIISVTVGGAYAGVMGMLVAVPLVAVLKDILDGYMEYRENKKLEMLGATDDEVLDDDSAWL